MNSSNFINYPWAFLGAPYGLGSSRKGAAFGPSAILKGGLAERLKGMGLEFSITDLMKPVFEPKNLSESKLKHIGDFLEFHQNFSVKVEQIYNSKQRPLIVGGDHAISISSISCASNFLRKSFGQDAELGVIWVDTHADINTSQTTPSGNIHGMPLAVLMGLGDSRLVEVCKDRPALKPNNLVYIGLRDVDSGEKNIIQELNIRSYTMHDIDEHGIAKVTRDAFSYLLGKTEGLVVSFDLDVCDPVIAPGVGTPVPAGITEREAHYIMEKVAMVPNLLSIEFVELNPELDDQNKSLELSLRLLSSAFGKTIL